MPASLSEQRSERATPQWRKRSSQILDGGNLPYRELAQFGRFGKIDEANGNRHLTK
jgi:hypothetical protein